MLTLPCYNTHSKTRKIQRRGTKPKPSGDIIIKISPVLLGVSNFIQDHYSKLIYYIYISMPKYSMHKYNTTIIYIGFKRNSYNTTLIHNGWKRMP